MFLLSRPDADSYSSSGGDLISTLTSHRPVSIMSTMMLLTRLMFHKQVPRDYMTGSR
jgi:hypothetical protein